MHLTVAMETVGVWYVVKQLFNSVAFQSKADNPQMCVFNYVRISFFCSCDIDLDRMTLRYESDLDILKMYSRTQSEFSRSMLSKVRAQSWQTDTQTHTRDLTHYRSRIRSWQKSSRVQLRSLLFTNIYQTSLPFDPFKSSDAKWLQFKVFRAILV